MKELTCKCGALIPDEDIDYSNGTNEEGEEYGVVSVICPVCKTEYECSQWGEWDGREDAKEYLIEHTELRNSYQGNKNNP